MTSSINTGENTVGKNAVGIVPIARMSAIGIAAASILNAIGVVAVGGKNSRSIFPMS